MAIRTINTLSAASGVEGIGIGLRTIIPTVTRCYVEREISAIEILRSRMENETIDTAPVWDDLRTFDARAWRGKVDLIHAGIPCQSFSVAGKRTYGDDERNLWPDFRRCIIGLGIPEFVFIENVPGFLRYYYDTIRPELRAMGYETEEGLFSAAETGAPHLRERVFVLAYRSGQPRDLQQRRARPELNRISGKFSDTGKPRLEGFRSAWEKERGETLPGLPIYPPGRNHEGEWSQLLRKVPEFEPSVCRVVDGIPERLHERLASLGNAVVPIVAAYAFINLAAAMASRSGFPHIFLEELYE